jgi:TonB family protein
MRPAGLPDIHELAATGPPDEVDPEPILTALPVLVEFDDPARLDPARIDADPANPPRRRALPPALGLLSSLLLHLLPFGLLLSWGTNPVETPAPIPVELVLEPPPLAPAQAPAQTPPPRGPLASEAIGETAGAPPPESAAAPPAPVPPAQAQPPPADPVSAEPTPPPQVAAAGPLPPPIPPKEPTAPRPASAPRPPAPPARPATATPRSEPRPHLSLREGRVPGPGATRDEYLAYLVKLTRRHVNLLPQALVGNRRGETVLSVLVLDDGRIARIAVSQSSGYPDIDERVERMVAAVGRFPPLPQWFQGSEMQLYLRLRFPEALDSQ